MILHSLMHWLGWNQGIIETWWEWDRVRWEAKLMVGFRCMTCWKLTCVSESQNYRHDCEIQTVSYSPKVGEIQSDFGEPIRMPGDLDEIYDWFLMTTRLQKGTALYQNFLDCFKGKES